MNINKDYFISHYQMMQNKNILTHFLFLFLSILVLTSLNYSYSFAQGAGCATITVDVTENSLPLYGAEVYLIGKTETRRISTDKTGNVAFANVCWANTGGDNSTFYVWVNPGIADFNGGGATAVRVLVMKASDNGKTFNEKFNVVAGKSYNYSISGNVIADGGGQSGINVRLQHDPSPYDGNWITDSSCITDANGAYHFGVSGDFVKSTMNWRVIVDNPGIQYAPSEYIYHTISQNMLNQNFTKVIAGQTRHISGNVYKYITVPTISPIENATIILYNKNATDWDINTSSVAFTQLSKSDGSYDFIVPNSANYILKVQMSGYDFTPSTYIDTAQVRSIDPATTDYNKTFYGELEKWSITSKVTDNIGNLKNVYLSLSPLLPNGQPGTTIATGLTGNDGTYTFSNVPSRGNYIVIPLGVDTGSFVPYDTIPGYSFSPSPGASIYFLLQNENVFFSASKSIVEVSGKILDSLNSPVQNIIVKLSGGATQQVSTNSSGVYQFFVPARTAYTIIPDSTLTGYRFVSKDAPPEVYKYDILADTLTVAKTNQNFKARLQVYTIKGQVIGGDGNGLDGIVVQLSGTNAFGQTILRTVTTSGGGYYTHIDTARGTYNVKPLGGDFYPPDRTFYTVVQDGSQNFTSTTNTRKITGYIRKTGTDPATGVNEIPISISSTDVGYPTLTFTTMTFTGGPLNLPGYYSVFVPAVLTSTPSTIYRTYRIVPDTIPDIGYLFTSYSKDFSTSLNLPYQDVGPLSNEVYDSINFIARVGKDTISGYVSVDGTRQNGYIVKLDTSNGSTGTVQILTYSGPDGNGYYRFVVNSFSTYKVYVSSSLYDFDPVFKEYINIVGNRTQDFTTTTTSNYKLYSIAGHIKVGTNPLPNVVVKLNNKSDSVTVTDNNGYYTFTARAGGTYAVTPSLTGYNFAVVPRHIPQSSPSDSVITNLLGDSTVDFSANAVTNLSISGTIYNNGVTLPNATVRLYTMASSPKDSILISTFATTLADGKYLFSNLEGHKTYKVTVQSTGFSFFPTTGYSGDSGVVYFADLSGSRVQDFATSVNSKKIFGFVKTAGGTGVNNIPINLNSYNPSIPFASSAITHIDATGAGYYEFIVPAGSTYGLKPQTIPDQGYHFNPDTVRVPSNTDSLTADFQKDFVAIPNTYAISGIVYLNNNLQQGITIKLDTSNGTTSGTIQTITGSDGSYSFGVNAFSTYTVYPVSSQLIYTPTSQTFTNLIGNKQQNFNTTSDALKKYTISGTITKSGGGALEGVVIKFNNKSDSIAVSNNTGVYTYTLNAGGTYSVTPIMTGYSFAVIPRHSPYNPPYDSVITNLQGDSIASFVATPINDLQISGTIYNNGSTMTDAAVRLYTMNTDVPKDSILVSGPFATLTDGKYSFTGLEAHKSYKVTVQSSGFSFIPTTGYSGDSGVAYFSDLSGSKIQDFATNVNTKKISGYIRTDLNTTNTGVNNITLSLVSGGELTQFTSSALTHVNTNESNYPGYYEFIVPAGNSYTVTPQVVPDQGYNFSPTSARVPAFSGVLTENQQQNFTAILNTYTIQGTIKDILGNVLISAPTITLSPFPVGVTFNYVSSTGIYTFSNVPALGNYDVTPTLSGFTFYPDKRSYPVLIRSEYQQDFIASNNSGPILSSPSNGSINNLLNTSFVWQKPAVGSDPVQYLIQVSQSTTFSSFVGGSNQTISGTTWTVTTSLVLGTQYYWRVQAIYSGGGRGNWSDIWSFTTTIGGPSIPTVITPINNAKVLITPTLAWNPVNNALDYEVQVYNNSSYNGNSLVSQITSGTSYTIPSSTLNYSTQYWWRVRARNALGTSDWCSYTNPVPSFTPTDFTNLNYYLDIVPRELQFDSVVLGRTKSLSIIVTNRGPQTLQVSQLIFTGSSDFSTVSKNLTPIAIPANGSKTITIDFTPTTIGQKIATLSVYHNDIGNPENPITVSMFGTAVRTMARIYLPDSIYFGRVPFLSGVRERTITVKNTSNVSGDYLVIDPLLFTSSDSIFSASPNSQTFIAPGSSFDLIVRFNPAKLGNLFTNTLIVNNTSLNNPNGRVNVAGTVYEGDLKVVPSFVNFGIDPEPSARKQTVQIINYANSSRTIFKKELSDPTGSYRLDDNNENVVLTGGDPGGTDLVVVVFDPKSLGKKDATLIITTNDPETPKLYVPITGNEGKGPIISITPNPIDFGDLKRGETKDTTVTISNLGGTELTISTKKFIDQGNGDKNLFSFLSGSTVPDVISSGEQKTIRIRVTGNLPVGKRTAQLELINNDQSNGNSTFKIDLTANIKTTAICLDVDKIIFPSVVVGTYKDSSVIITNCGNEPLIVSNMLLDGSNSDDFKFIGLSTPFVLEQGETKKITVRFEPLAGGTRSTRIIVKSNDPVIPEKIVMLRGIGVVQSPQIGIAQITGQEYILDFGSVPILETRTRQLTIVNLSSILKLTVESIYLTSTVPQPFSFESITLPFTLAPGETKDVNITFLARAEKNSYEGYFNIKSNDTSKGGILTVKLLGRMIEPGLLFQLNQVLKFGKVVLATPKTVGFGVVNVGSSYLRIDSLALVGTNISEFYIHAKTYPFRIDPDEKDSTFVTFTPKSVGAKDAKIIFYCNDTRSESTVEIMAEGIAGTGQTLGISKTNEIPTVYSLTQNYPNPFNPSTRFEFGLPEDAFVSLKVYNYLGQELEVLVNGQQSAGTYIIDWHPNNLPSGMYFYKMQTSKYTQIKKMLYIR